MAFAKARTALAQVEEKLRRQFGLAGEVGARFEPVITPVVIAGDLRQPGNAANVGRWFAYGSGVLAYGANVHFCVQPQMDCYIDQVTFAASAAASIGLTLFVPGAAIPVAVANLAGSWVDRKMVAGDQVPILVSAAPAGAGFAPSIWSGQVAANVTMIVPVEMMLPAGSTLDFQIGAATGLVGLRGRVWP